MRPAAILQGLGLMGLLLAAAPAYPQHPSLLATLSAQSRVHAELVGQGNHSYGFGTDLDVAWQVLNAGLGLRNLPGENWGVALVGVGLWDVAQLQWGLSPHGALNSFDVNLRLGHFRSGAHRHRGWGAWGIKAGAEIYHNSTRHFTGYVGLSWTWASPAGAAGRLASIQ